MQEKKTIWVENILIILCIAALWPAILGFPGSITWPLLGIALFLMIAINVRRWKRLIRLREERRKALHGNPEGNCGPENKKNNN